MRTSTPRLSRGLENFEANNTYARCLVPLLEALGWRGNHDQLLAALPHVPGDMDMEDFLNTMANLRFEGAGMTIRADEINPSLLPCIFLNNDGDPVVILTAKGGQETVYDPVGAEFLTRPRAGQTGQLIVFTPITNEARNLLSRQKNWFAKIMIRFRRVFVQALLLSFFMALISIISPLLIMTIYDQVAVARSDTTLIYLIAGALIFIGADSGFRIMRSAIVRYVSVRMGNIIGIEVLRRILYLPPTYTETASIGSQVSRIKDFENIREFFASPAMVALMELPFVILMLIALNLIGGSVVYAPLVALALFGAIGVVLSPLIQKTNTMVAQTGSEKQAFIVEMLGSLRAIKHSSATALWSERYRELSAAAAYNNYKAASLSGLINASSSALGSVAGILTMAIGAHNVIIGQMSVGALAASMILVWRVLAPLRSGFAILAQIGRIRRSVDQVDRLMNIPLETSLTATHASIPALAGNIRFSQISFRYSREAAPALSRINLEVKPGQIALISGHDGAGKSTILKLILGLYNPQAGRVLIDNVNVRQLDPISLREAIGYAPSGAHFFYGKISQNLRLAYPTATDDEVRDAADKAGALADIDALPEGFETRLGDQRINRLPYSLRKRISLARVFLHRPQIMLFDEPEAGLSDQDLDHFIEVLREFQGKATVIIASTNQRFLEVADTVALIEKGRLRLQGTPEQINAQNQGDVASTKRKQTS